MTQIDVSLLGWLLLQGTLVGAAGAVLAALAPGLSAGARARIALASLILMSAVGFAGTGSLAAWSWGDWLLGTGMTAGKTAPPIATDIPGREELADDSTAEAVDDAGTDEPLLVSDGITDWATAFARIFESADQTPEAVSWQAAPHEWWMAAVVAIVAAQMLGLVRLLWGGLWLALCRRRATTVDDAAMQSTLQDIADELGLRRVVEIAEVADLSTPALIGWRRPIILLPNDWRGWSVTERRAVLAHELAHVRRRDVLATTIAGFALVPQFYHPLAHLLAARMRVEQEIAADVIACGPAGGRERYLRALVGLALRRADARTGWPANAFLPRRRMFIRRIEMLRSLRMMPPRGAAAWNTAAVLGLTAIAAAVTGLRPLPAVAQQKGTSTRDAQQGATAPITIVDPLPFMASPDIAAIVDLDIQRLRQSRQMQPLLADGPDEVAGRIETLLGAPLAKVHRVTIGLANPSPSAPLGQYAGHVVTYADVDATETVGAPDLALGQFSIALQPRDADAGDDSLDPVDRVRVAPTTILFGTPAQMRTLLLAALDDQPPADSLAARLMRFDSSDGKSQRPPVYLASDVSAVRPIFKRALREAGAQSHLTRALEPLVMDVDTVLLGITLQRTLKISGRLDCPSVGAAKRVADTLGAVRVLARNALQTEAGPDLDPISRTMADSLLPAARRLVESLEFAPGDASVTIQGHVEAPQLVAMAVPAIQRAHNVALRLRSLSNLRDLGLAFHEYSDIHGHLPAAVVEGPDGVKRSWRVELLPFLGEAQLYDRYRKDEPWDSDTNLQVLNEMPAVFRHPSQPLNSTDAAYLTIVGTGTALSGDEPKFEDFTDGLRNTILLVEANRAVPWTKPDDLPLDPKAILTGGFTAADIAAVFGDGAVRVLSDETDVELLRKMITRSGGERIAPEELPWVWPGR